MTLILVPIKANNRTNIYVTPLSVFRVLVREGPVLHWRHHSIPINLFSAKATERSKINMKSPAYVRVENCVQFTDLLHFMICFVFF